MCRIRALVVALRRALELLDHRRAPRDVARRRLAGQHPVLLAVQEVVGVAAEHERSARELVRQQRRVEITQHRRCQEADAAARELPLGASDEVVRRRLDQRAIAQKSRDVCRVLAGRHRFDDPDAPVVAGLSRQLGGAEDRRRARGVDEIPRGAHRRRPSDATRVEEIGGRGVEAEEVVRAAPPEIVEDLGPFDEEPPLLRVERLVGRQIDYRGIDFRLAEVRIDRRVEDQSALDRGLEVDAERAEGAGAVVEGIAVRRVDELLPRRHVGRDLQPPPRMGAVEPREVHHPRGHAAVVLRPELEPDRLVLAVDEAGDVDAPGLLRGFLESQLGERDPQLRRPACVVLRDPGAPHRVPRIVPEVVIGEHAVSLHTGSADRELHAGAVIVARIQVERDAVGVGPLIASGQSLRDRGRLRVEHPRAHVERVVVVEEADLGALRRRLAFIRIALPEVVRRRRLRPYLIVQASVDRRGSGDSECLQRGSCRVGRRWLSGGYGRLLRVHRHRCPDHCRRQQEQGAQVREVHRTFDYRQARCGGLARACHERAAAADEWMWPATSEPRSGESSGLPTVARSMTVAAHLRGCAATVGNLRLHA